MQLSTRYGSDIFIRNCILGKNLNLAQIRGFSEMDMLSDISLPDVYDQVTNPLGTQRGLIPGHAKEASEYAFAAVEADPNNDPRSFPEVIFNVRETPAVTVFSNGNEVDFSQLEDLQDVQIVDVRINVSFLEEMGDSISISRVDGNHRLSRVPAIDERENIDFPCVSFALFVGLTLDQERKLFSDINGHQQVMNTSHLAQIAMNAGGPKLLLDSKTRPLWLAQELMMSGQVFQDVVYTGGAKAGIKTKIGAVPPITLSQLRAALGKTLNGMQQYTNELFPSDLIQKARDLNDSDALNEIKGNAEVLKTAISQFWLAVKHEYPEAWQDGKKKEFILFNSIGMDALSRIAAEVIRELVENKSMGQTDFDLAIRHIRNGGITLEKKDFQGMAGGTGANKVFELLMTARQEGSEGILAVKDLLMPKAPSKLDS